MKCARCVIESSPNAVPEDVPNAITQIAGTLVCRNHALAVAATPGAEGRDIVLRSRRFAGPVRPPVPPRS